jgi:queuine tRNA-ribosyltransferase accessory subunit
VIAPPATSNTNSTIAVGTSVGFRSLKAEDYAEAVENLRPDIVVGLGDIPYGRALGSKRIEKATDRSIEWLQDHVSLREVQGKTTAARPRLFASLLPVSCANQQYYIDSLLQDVGKDVHGLTFFSPSPLEDLPDELSQLPRLAFTEPATPHDVLQHISLGLDIVTIPFVTAATDAGIALDFTFPAPSIPQVNGDAQYPRTLGIDMWQPEHAACLEPLLPSCKCYACTDFHRAYLQHLLNAKEMLAWVLLQIHNHHVIDLFFSGIRQSIHDGTFEEEMKRFAKVYESQLPEKTGQGPRMRGYQYKSEGPGEAKRNPAPFQMLDDGKEKLAESVLPSADADADDLEGQGFAEKQT